MFSLFKRLMQIKHRTTCAGMKSNQTESSSSFNLIAIQVREFYLKTDVWKCNYRHYPRVQSCLNRDLLKTVQSRTYKNDVVVGFNQWSPCRKLGIQNYPMNPWNCSYQPISLYYYGKSRTLSCFWLSPWKNPKTECSQWNPFSIHSCPMHC